MSYVGINKGVSITDTPLVIVQNENQIKERGITKWKTQIKNSTLTSSILI